MTILRKDIRAIRCGDRFQISEGEREVVSVRPCMFLVAGGGTVPGTELLHKSPHRPGVAYLQAPEGSQICILIP